MKNAGLRTWLVVSAAIVAVLPLHRGLAEQPKASGAGAAAAAGNMADFFSQVVNEIYEDCIFELSEEQIEVQQALIQAYIKQGATSVAARKLAVKQIEPPKLSERCEQIRSPSKSSPWASGTTTTPLPQLREFMAVYRQRLAAAGHPWQDDQMALMLPVHVGPTGEAARRAGMEFRRV